MLSKQEIDVARRAAALLVTLKGKIDMARRHSALLVTSKRDVELLMGWGAGDCQLIVCRP